MDTFLRPSQKSAGFVAKPKKSGKRGFSPKIRPIGSVKNKSAQLEPVKSLKKSSTLAGLKPAEDKSLFFVTNLPKTSSASIYQFIKTTHQEGPKAFQGFKARSFSSYSESEKGEKKEERLSPSFIICTHITAGFLMKSFKLFSVFGDNLLLPIVVALWLQFVKWCLSFEFFESFWRFLDSKLLSTRWFFTFFFELFLAFEAALFVHPGLMGSSAASLCWLATDWGFKIPVIISVVSLFFSLYMKLRSAYVVPSVRENNRISEQEVVESFYARSHTVKPLMPVYTRNLRFPGFFLSSASGGQQRRGIKSFTSMLESGASGFEKLAKAATLGLFLAGAGFWDASNREKFRVAGELIKDSRSNVNKDYDQCQRQPGVDPAKLKELAGRKEDFDRSCDAESNRLASTCEKGAISRNITSEDPFKTVERVQSKSDAFSSKATEAIKGGIDAQAASKPLNDEVIQARVDRAVSESLKKAGIPVPPKASPSSPKSAPKGKGPGDDEGPFGGVGPFGGSGPSLPGGGSGPEHPPIPPLPSIQFSWWELFF